MHVIRPDSLTILARCHEGEHLNQPLHDENNHLRGGVIGWHDQDLIPLPTTRTPLAIIDHHTLITTILPARHRLLVNQPRHLQRRFKRLFGLPVHHKLNAPEQSPTTDITDVRVAAQPLPEQVPKVPTLFPNIAQQTIPLDDPLHRQRRGGHDGVVLEGVAVRERRAGPRHLIHNAPTGQHRRARLVPARQALPDALRGGNAAEGRADDGLGDEGCYGAGTNLREDLFELGGLAPDEVLVGFSGELLAVGVASWYVVDIRQEDLFEVGSSRSVPGQ
ncbi:hypothetical protein VMCG_00172 [Cytospora schulzeri]|uniref:Uncharacterized protein n=1 Tax=Cytospora schulzeri TaxID=448051 RepID=A0A423X9M9_9PEZI|nr:hypothetical protein VMCG_00172 [Valsa malicola]